MTVKIFRCCSVTRDRIGGTRNEYRNPNEAFLGFAGCNVYHPRGMSLLQHSFLRATASSKVGWGENNARTQVNSVPVGALPRTIDISLLH